MQLSDKFFYISLYYNIKAKFKSLSFCFCIMMIYY